MGLHNPVSIRRNPERGKLWSSVQERGGLGDGPVPDYLHRGRLRSVLRVDTHASGGHGGWPRRRSPRTCCCGPTQPMDFVRCVAGAPGRFAGGFSHWLDGRRGFRSGAKALYSARLSCAPSGRIVTAQSIPRQRAVRDCGRWRGDCRPRCACRSRGCRCGHRERPQCRCSRR